MKSQFKHPLWGSGGVVVYLERSNIKPSNTYILSPLLEATEDSTIFCVYTYRSLPTISLIFSLLVRGYPTSLVFLPFWFVRSLCLRTTITSIPTMCLCILQTLAVSVTKVHHKDDSPFAPCPFTPCSQLSHHLFLVCDFFSSGPLLWKTIPSETETPKVSEPH